MNTRGKIICAEVIPKWRFSIFVHNLTIDEKFDSLQIFRATRSHTESSLNFAPPTKTIVPVDPQCERVLILLSKY
jgi:hypothetical protein